MCRNGVHAATMNGMGPFLVRVHQGFAQEILQKLGFLTVPHDAEEAATAFCDMNKRHLRRRNCEIDYSSKDILSQLQAIFSSHTIEQDWICPDWIFQE